MVVAAHRAARDAVPRQLEARDLGQLLGDEITLDVRGELRVALQQLLLVLHLREPLVLDANRRVVGQNGQQLQVGRREAPARRPRVHVEQADDLLLGPQRHGHQGQDALAGDAPPGVERGVPGGVAHEDRGPLLQHALADRRADPESLPARGARDGAPFFERHQNPPFGPHGLDGETEDGRKELREGPAGRQLAARLEERLHHGVAGQPPPPPPRVFLGRGRRPALRRALAGQHALEARHEHPPGRCVQLLTGVELDGLGGGPLGGVEHRQDPPRRDPVARAQLKRSLDARPVEEGAVLAAQIPDGPPAGPVLQDEVAPREARVGGQRQVVVVGAPDAHVKPVERHAPRRAPVVADQKGRGRDGPSPPFGSGVRTRPARAGQEYQGARRARLSRRRGLPAEAKARPPLNRAHAVGRPASLHLARRGRRLDRPRSAVYSGARWKAACRCAARRSPRSCWRESPFSPAPSSPSSHARASGRRGAARRSTRARGPGTRASATTAPRASWATGTSTPSCRKPPRFIGLSPPPRCRPLPRPRRTSRPLASSSTRR